MSALEAVVAAVDLSAPSREAVAVAASIAGRHAAKLYLLHVIDTLAHTLPAIAAEEEGIGPLFELAERRAAGARTVEVVRIGRPGSEVAAFAAEKGAKLIVTGTHGRRGLSRLVAGSVAGEIMKRATCPVVVVPEGGGEPRASFHRVLAAIDYSEASRAALRAVNDLDPSSELVALHVLVDQAAPGEPRLADERARLSAWLADTLPGRTIEARVMSGEPGAVLADLATNGHYDLIACGTHGRGSLGVACFGSIAERLLQAADRPVLAVRTTPERVRATAVRP